MSKETKTKQSEILNKLGIKSIQDLRQYVLNQYLELIESDKIGIKMQALKEVSRYLFSTTGMTNPIGADLKNEKSIFDFN